MVDRFTDATLNRPGHYVALKLNDGWWFTQVLGSTVEEYKPYVLANENGNADVIASETAGNEDEMTDSNNRHFLEPNDDERNVMHQVLVGVDPSRMELTPIFGREQNLGLESALSPGGDDQWLSGTTSPYSNPTEQGEVFIINDMSRFTLRAYNPTDRAREARVRFVVNKLNYATVTNVNLMKAILQNQITAKRHELGLGALEKDQLDAPTWLSNAFGEHIMSTAEIINNGDTSQLNRGADTLDFRGSTELEGAERGGA